MITKNSIDRIVEALRITTPIIALYDTAPSEDFDPLVVARGRACCFAFYERWLKGHTLVVEKGNGAFADGDAGCPGMQRAFGLEAEYPPYMANFLTDGKNGAPMGEGLKASPELAQEFLDFSRAPKITGETILLGPLRLEKWDVIRSLTFFVNPDRLAGLMTLATYHSGPDDTIMAPFSSGCGLMLKEMENREDDPALIGSTDLAMRKYLPPDILSLTVSPARFKRMLNVPDDSFLFKNWWNDLMNSRK